MGFMKGVKGDKFLAFLPLAHVMGRFIMYYSIALGVGQGFFQGNMFKITEDLKELKPTHILSVPRIYTRIYDVLLSKMSAAKGFKKKLINRAVKVKLENLRKDGSVRHKMYDAIVFKKMKETVGGNIKLMTTAGAPISKDVLELLKICFCAPITEGYGLTETLLISMTHPRDQISGQVGYPLLSGEVKLVDVPDMNYFVHNVVSAQRRPQGEVRKDELGLICSK
jgi:long-chain acyl-CoA synthetase